MLDPLIDPEPGRRINRLAPQDLARVPDPDPAFLAAACGGDLFCNVESATRTIVAGGPDDTAGRSHVRPAGQMIGRYRMQSHLGVGGVGEVWLAADTILDRKVALKLLRPELTGASDRLQRFFREARAASALNHPNILTIYDIGEADGIQFIATEFIAGVTLRRRLADGPMEMPEAVATTTQIVAALETAHRAGIVHRDIKPENVMLRPDGLVKVLDFGLARVSEAQTGQYDPAPARDIKTDPGKVMGTLDYMSPEQARGLEVDARSDIFSLGIVLYEMLAGKRPFEGKTSTDVLVAIVNKPPVPLSCYLPDAPVALYAAVAKALQKDTNARYQTMGDFAAALQTLVSARATTTSTRDLQPELPPVRSPRRRRATMAWAAVALSAAFGFGIYSWRQPSSAPAAPPKVVPLIGFPGVKDYPAFSPDESRIAFAWDGGRQAQFARRDIYVKEIGAGEPVRLTTSLEDDILPDWSPDGRYIAFERVLPTHHDVYRVSAMGGSEQKIAETLTGTSWWRDGKTLAVAGVPVPGNPGGIFLVSLETGTRRRLTTAAPSTTDQYPTFSPDGEAVAYLRSYVGMTEFDVFVVPVNGGTSKQVTFDRNRINGLTWTSDSREIVYSAIRAGVRSLWRVAARGGGPQEIPSGQNPSFPVISRSGHKLAWSDTFRDSNIWQAKGTGFVGRPAPGKFSALAPMLAFPREDHSPAFSPDGKQIVFASGRSGGEDLWICDRDGHHLMQLTTDGGPTGSPQWSPDGRWIAFDSHSRGDADIYVVSVNGGPWRRLTSEPSSDTQPAWSHDGRWIYFKSNRSGRQQYYKVPAEGGTPVQVTHTGAFEGRESPDGKLLYFTKGRGVYGIWSVPVEGGPETLVPELRAAGYWRSWGVMKEGIYFISKEPAARQTIRFFSFATRRITPLLAVDKEPLWWQAGLALSPDGRDLLYAQLDHAVEDIMLMENFR